MSDRTFYDWPFLEARHRALARELEAWCPEGLKGLPKSVEAATRELVDRLADGGWLRYVVPAQQGGVRDGLDLRAICLIRDTLARHEALADFAFAMQGLGSAPITLYGSDGLKARWLPDVARGNAIAAFAISEEHAGSDIGAMRTTAVRDGSEWVIDGHKMWISNAGIADFYIVFCRLPKEGERAYGAFIVDADNRHVRTDGMIDTIAPHVLGSLRFDACRVPDTARVGEVGKGLRVALGTLDVFRPSVGAAALGMARRALDEAVAWVTKRKTFGRTLGDHQITQARIAEMALDVDAAALLVYRAAWAKDSGQPRVTREASMAKLFATESAQRVIDGAVQLLGGRGVVSGHPVEKLYREVRALRIYEGTSEIQKLVIAATLLRNSE